MATPETMCDECVQKDTPLSRQTLPFSARRGQHRAASTNDRDPGVEFCYPNTLTKAEKWYQIPRRRFHLAMHVGEDIPMQEFSSLQPRSISVRCFNSYLQNYFTQR